MITIDPVRTLLLILLDSCLWVGLHFAFGYVAHRIPSARFVPDGWLFRTRRWERDGAFYAHRLKIKSWKARLPEGGDIFRGGFDKSRLASHDAALLSRFVRETCRAEASHWLVLLAGPFFFIWNPWYIGIGMVLYGLAANLPCILVQRYNRPRLVRASARKSTRD